MFFYLDKFRNVILYLVAKYQTTNSIKNVAARLQLTSISSFCVNQEILVRAHLLGTPGTCMLFKKSNNRDNN